MKNKRLIIVSLTVLFVALICMEISRQITPFSDVAIRVIGTIMLIDIAVLSYSIVKVKNSRSK